MQTSEKDDDEITFEVVDGERCGSRERHKVAVIVYNNNIGGLPRATVTSHAKISLPNTIRIMFSAIQMSDETPCRIWTP